MQHTAKLKGWFRVNSPLGRLHHDIQPLESFFPLGRTLVKLEFSADWLSNGTNGTCPVSRK